MIPYPVHMTISRQEDVVVDLVIIEMIECSVSVRDIALLEISSGVLLSEGRYWNLTSQVSPPPAASPLMWENTIWFPITRQVAFRSLDSDNER